MKAESSLLILQKLAENLYIVIVASYLYNFLQ